MMFFLHLDTEDYNCLKTKRCFPLKDKLSKLKRSGKASTLCQFLKSMKHLIKKNNESGAFSEISIQSHPAFWLHDLSNKMCNMCGVSKRKDSYVFV